MALKSAPDAFATRARSALAIGAVILLGIFISMDANAAGWPATLLISIVGALLMAMAIGANDAANLMASSVGARLISLPTALIIAALCEVAGAMIGADTVVNTVTTKLLMLPESGFNTQLLFAMGAAPFAAACWIYLATLLRLPVSTTHSLIGAITGAAIAMMGMNAIAWPVLMQLGVAWLWSPFLGLAFAAGLYALMQLLIIEADDPAAAFKRALPILNGGLTGVVTAYVAIKAFPGLSLTAILPASMMTAIIVGAVSLTRGASVPQGSTVRVMTATYLRIPVLIAAASFAFAHGANDVANAIAPLAIVQHLLTDGQIETLDVSLSALAIGGIAIGLGILVFGGRLTLAIGRDLTRLSPLSTLAALMAVGVTVLFASAIGLPVSSTHTALAAIFGVGIAREMLTDARWRRARIMRLNQTPKAAIKSAALAKRRRLIRRQGIFRIVAAWLVTLPIAALLGWGTATLGTALFD